MSVNVTEIVQSVTVEETTQNILIQLAGVQGPAGSDAPSDHTLLSNIGTKTHAQLESEISDRIPYAGAAADIDLGGVHKVINSEDPSGDQDLVTKIYSDTGLATKEPVITSGTTSQYWRGDKTWQPISGIVSGYVPYTGASSDLNLGAYTLISSQVRTSSLLDSLSSVSVEVENRLLKNSTGIGVVNYENGELRNPSGGDVAVDLQNTSLMNYGVQIYNWTTGLFYNGINYTADVMNRYLVSSYSNNVLAWVNGVVVYDTNGTVAADFTTAMSSSSGILHDNNGLFAISFRENGRFLYDSNGFQLVDFENGVLNDKIHGFNSVAWADRYLVCNNVVVLDWGSLQANDYSSLASIKWDTRRFCDTAGQEHLDYSANQQIKIIGSMMLGTSFMSPTAKLHLDGGTATASTIKFTAGTTTGLTSTDGVDIGISSTGIAQIRQRENNSVEIYTANVLRAQWTGAGNIFLDGSIQARGAAGSAAVPFWGFSTSSDCGMYRGTGSSIGLATSGVARLFIDSAGKVTIYQGTTLHGAMSTVYSQVNSVGNVGTGEDNLHSFSVPSGGFAANGDSFEVKCAGTFAANANNKRVKLKFGAITLFDTTALAFNTGDWQINARIFRTTTTTGKSIVTWTCNNVTLTTTVDYQAWAFNFLTANTLVVTGEATADNDIVQELMQVFWIPVA